MKWDQGAVVVYQTDSTEDLVAAMHLLFAEVARRQVHEEEELCQGS